VCTVAWHGVEGAGASCMEMWRTGLQCVGLVWGAWGLCGVQQGQPIGGRACEVALVGCCSVAWPGDMAAKSTAMRVGDTQCMTWQPHQHCVMAMFWP
jgi:hypothetical protein